MIRVFQEHNCEITKRIFCVSVRAKPINVNKNLCDGILKRVFSKQICFTYRIEAFDLHEDSFRIFFRFVCWNSEGQRERYKKFRRMPQEKLEENLSAHNRKTIDNFVGEFFKRLRRKKYEVVIGNENAELTEEIEQEIPKKAHWRRMPKPSETEDD